MSDPYKALGLSENATDEDIKKTRRKLLFDLHSDRLPKDLPEGAARLINERVLEINDAFNEIMKIRSYKSSKQSATSTESQTSKSSRSYSSGKPESTRTDQAPKASDGNNNQKQQASPSGSKNQAGPGSQFSIMSGRIVGVLIGIALMQTCRSLVTNKGASENTRQKAEDIIYSSNNYCPELAESIRQRDYSGKSKVLKLLSEMLRSSPEGSKFRDQVNAVITKLLTNNQKDKESIQQDVAALFNQYLPVVCEGDLQVAKMDAGGNPESTSIPEDFSKAQLTYARAICSALRSNEKMETMDEMRSVGAVYMGREMDLLANEDKIQTMKELANQTGNSKWISQATVAVVKECPEDAYKMAEE